MDPSSISTSSSKSSLHDSNAWKENRRDFLREIRTAKHSQVFLVLAWEGNRTVLRTPCYLLGIEDTLCMQQDSALNTLLVQRDTHIEDPPPMLEAHVVLFLFLKLAKIMHELWQNSITYFTFLLVKWEG